MTEAYTDEDTGPRGRSVEREISEKLRKVQAAEYSVTSPAVYTINVVGVSRGLCILKASKLRWVLATVEDNCGSARGKCGTGRILTKPILYREARDCAILIREWAEMVMEWDARRAARLENAVYAERSPL